MVAGAADSARAGPRALQAIALVFAVGDLRRRSQRQRLAPELALVGGHFGAEEEAGRAAAIGVVPTSASNPSAIDEVRRIGVGRMRVRSARVGTACQRRGPVADLGVKQRGGVLVEDQVCGPAAVNINDLLCLRS